MAVVEDVGGEVDEGARSRSQRSAPRKGRAKSIRHDKASVMGDLGPATEGPGDYMIFLIPFAFSPRVFSATHSRQFPMFWLQTL